MTIFVTELKNSWKSLAIWSFCLFLFMLLVSSVYPSISETEGVQDFINNIDGIDFVIANADLSSPEGWINTEFFGLLLPIIMMVIGVGAGSSTIKNEQNSGTLELLLARPIPRWNILLQKAAVIEAKLLIIGVVLFVGIWTGTQIVPEFSLSMGNVLWVIIHLVLLVFPFAYGALAITTWGGSKSLSRSAIIIAYVVMYFTNTFATSVDWIKTFQPISLHNYYSSLDVLTDGPKGMEMFILLIVTVCIYSIAHIGFIQRDA